MSALTSITFSKIIHLSSVDCFEVEALRILTMFLYALSILDLLSLLPLYKSNCDGIGLPFCTVNTGSQYWGNLFRSKCCHRLLASIRQLAVLPTILTIAIRFLLNKLLTRGIRPVKSSRLMPRVQFA